MLAAFAVATVVMTWPMAANVSTHIADVGVGDQLLYARMLRHFLAVLTGAHGGLFDVDFYWPHPNALATTDAALGILYGALPFIAFTRDLLTLVNLGFLLTFTLTAHATWLLARELSGSRTAALAAAIGFAFCAYRFHQLDHLNVLQTQWICYALYLLLKLSQRPTVARAVLFGGATTLYATASINVALYTSPLFILAIALTVLGAAKDKRRTLLIHVVPPLVVAALIVLPLYLPYLEARAAHDLHWTQWYFDQYSGRLEQLRAVPSFNRMYGATHGHLLGPESITFCGYGTLLLALAALALSPTRFWEKRSHATPLVVGIVIAAVGWFWMTAAFRQPGVGFILIAIALALAARMALSPEPYFKTSSFAWLLFGVGVFCVLAAFGPIVRERSTTVAAEGLWVSLSKLPGFNSVRTPARMFLVAQLCASLLAALGLAEILRRVKDVRFKLAVAAIALLVIASESYAQPVPMRPVIGLAEGAPSTHKWIAQRPGNGGVVELPIYEPVERARMFYSLVHDRPILNGEAGFQLPLLKSLMHGAINEGKGVANLRRLRAAGLQFVIVDRQVARGAAQQYGQLVTAAGGKLVAQLPDGEVFQFDTVTATRPSASNLSGTVRLIGNSLDVTLTARDWVFEFETRRVKVELGGEIVGELYFSPPLFAPGDSVTKTLSLDKTPGGSAFKLVDDSGAVWADGALSP